VNTAQVEKRPVIPEVVEAVNAIRSTGRLQPSMQDKKSAETSNGMTNCWNAIAIAKTVF